MEPGEDVHENNCKIPVAVEQEEVKIHSLKEIVLLNRNYSLAVIMWR